MMSSLYGVYGASGCGRGILPLARKELQQRGISLDRLVFVDDRPEIRLVNGHQVLSYAEFLQKDATERHVVLAIADSAVREKLAARCAFDGVKPWTVRAENSVLMDDVILGEGAVLSPFVVLTSNIRIGRYFHANLFSYIEHDCVIGDFVTFAPGVKCNGNVLIEEHVYIGAGAVIKQGRPGKPLRIGRNSVIGMGAVVVRDVPPGTTVVGNPAKALLRG